MAKFWAFTVEGTVTVYLAKFGAAAIGGSQKTSDTGIVTAKLPKPGRLQPVARLLLNCTVPKSHYNIVKFIFLSSKMLNHTILHLEKETPANLGFVDGVLPTGAGTCRVHNIA
ncbi:unnamed protein product [Rhizophagus irregularis]|nr:unnamed protein product [Rhizophagus irregularis]CAB5375408.1 unnamed protein product [Rhizophagus irregularis]